jgi:hypothetical protein
MTVGVLRTSSPNQPSVLSAPLQLSPYSSVDLSPAESAAIAAAARAGGSPAADDPFMDLEEIEGACLLPDLAACCLVLTRMQAVSF